MGKRNELCACGSGRKYKKCCLPRGNKPNDGDSVEVIPVEAARQRIGAPPDVFQCLALSGLLGPVTERGISPNALESFIRFGTQWDPQLGERTIPYGNLPLSPDAQINKQPTFTYTHMQLAPANLDFEAADHDHGWLAQFYLRPNRYFYPDPTALALIGPLLLKLPSARQVSATDFPTYLYPDPSGSLAMIMVIARPARMEDAFRVAYDIVTPVLDELSVQYDLPLPIAHSLILRIPSCIMEINYPKTPSITNIDAGRAILARCPHPELQRAVALYREAISSNNPFHQFLTLWKVYENACSIRGDWRRKHKIKDTRIHQEIVPDEFAFGTYAKLTFDKAKQEMAGPYRDAIAHADMIKSTPKTAAAALDFVDLWTRVPVIRHMARTVLENVRATLDSTFPPTGVSQT